MTGQASALLLATGFVLGCDAIYDLRPRTCARFGILLRVALCLVPQACVMVVAR